MTELTIIDGLKQIINLHRARRYLSKNRFKTAKVQVEKALAYGCRADDYSLALALKAFVLIKEGGQVDEARIWLNECMSALGDARRADASYISAHCQAWLAMSDETIGYAEIIDAALNANAARIHASGFAKMILPHFPIEELIKIFGKREPKRESTFLFDGSNRDLKVEVGFDF